MNILFKYDGLPPSCNEHNVDKQNVHHKGMKLLITKDRAIFFTTPLNFYIIDTCANDMGII